MRNNGTNHDITQMRDELISSIGIYIHSIKSFLKERNLNYENVLSYHALDDKRIVFDVHTKQKYTVHVDTIQSKCTVEQFLDCLYGAGSESDHKMIIYKGDNEPINGDYEYPDLKCFSPEEYFVSLLVERCNMIGVPFSIIEFSRIYDGLLLGPPFENRKEYKMTETSNKLFKRLPSKWDIQRMAFWALYFNACLPDKYHLEDLHSTESIELKILNDLCVLVKWDDDGISYIISDSHKSDFIFWLWTNRIKNYSKYYTLYRSPSFYRDGSQSRICIPGDGVPIHKLNEMSEDEQKMLGVQLYRGARKLRSEVINIWNESNGSSQHIIEEEHKETFSDLDF